MSYSINRDGHPVTLKAGNCIIYDTAKKCLILNVAATAGMGILWADNTWEKPANFIRTLDDFAEFAKILAETHGLDAKRLRPNCIKGPIFEFV